MVSYRDRPCDEGTPQRRNVVRTGAEETSLTYGNFGADSDLVHRVAINAIAKNRELPHLEIPGRPHKARGSHFRTSAYAGTKQPQKKQPPAIQNTAGRRTK
jgi:hypothetical protein